MSVSFTPMESKVLKRLMERLSDELSCAGSNDFEIPEGVFTEEERFEMAEKIKENYSEEDQEEMPDELHDGDILSDFDLAALISKKLEKVK